MSSKLPLPPSKYQGQDLCPRCGSDSDGQSFAICHDGFSHEESCLMYRYRDLCATCESTLTETEK